VEVTVMVARCSYHKPFLQVSFSKKKYRGRTKK